MTGTPITIADVRALDASDSLACFRERFALPEDVIYLDGNSLGALPRSAPTQITGIVEKEWGRSLIRSWNDHDWIGAPARIGDKIASLMGARAGEVIAADSTSVNLFKLLGALVRQQSERSDIVTETGNFPTDLHVAEGIADLFGKRLLAVPTEAVPDAIGADTAAVVLSHVHYRSGYRHDMRVLTAHAKAAGTRIIWDLSHSIGAVPLDLHANGAELAIGCGYKYLNGGPGAPAFLYVAHHLQAALVSPIRGWMGHAAPFEFRDEYRPAPGIDRFLAGTPPILGLAGLEAGVDIALEADQQALFDKAQRMFALFTALMAERCPEFRLVSPAMAAERGSHISYAHPEARVIMNALIARGVIGDFRAPDIARFGLTPLYLRFEDIWHAVDTLADIMASGAWRSPEHARRGRVT
jgi:kynureninase